MKNNVLIVGASGGIASALIEQYSSDGARVFAVSRAPLSDTNHLRLDAGGAARLAPRRLGAPKLAAVTRRVGARNCRVAGHVEARPGGGGTLDLVRGGRPRPLDVDILVEFGVGEC